MEGNGLLGNQIIDFKRLVLRKELRKMGRNKHIGVMNTHLFLKVLQPGRTADGGRRWLHKSDIDDVSLPELLLIPVGYFEHWALMVIDFAKRAIKSIDSNVAYTNLCCPDTFEEAIIGYHRL
jgi:Ulp1 family protease